MQGASRASFKVAREQLVAAVADPAAAATVAGELFEVVRLLDREAGLRRAMTDVTSRQEARTGLVRGLFGGRVSQETLDLLAKMTAERWSVSRDLTDAAEELAVLATAASADSAGQLDELEDELFRFGQIAGSVPDLYAALSNPVLPEGRKRGLLEALLGGKASQQAQQLIAHAVTYPRGRSLEANLSEYARLVATWRQRLIALVRAATELTDEQRERLTAALSAIYGRGIQLNVVTDPGVVGGISIQIGDEFIDGSVASRLAALRRRLAA